ncbi:unnamed protein product [Strongylus vulgaris]|uniref:Uncharacterized protein n=1 Tax=Strongylus vulgaris TaxID=40348 RepID=A0A3P7IYH0_STRVU|nr:unnamed protein product [Strongylus vulgaris]
MEVYTENAGKREAKRRNMRTIIFGAIATVVILALVGVVIWLSVRPGKEDQDARCSKLCHNPKFLQPHPPLIVISLDGYAHKYLSKKIQPTLEKIAECGVSAKVYSSFPSQTFPNHIVMATGLYPGHHGIVGNTIYDRNLSSKPEYLGTNSVDGHYVKEPVSAIL